VAYADTLKNLRTSLAVKNKTEHKEIEDILLEKIFNSELNGTAKQYNQDDHHSNDQAPSVASASRSVAYNLAGFLAYKGRTLSQCDGCVKSLIDPFPASNDMQLTALKDFGGLKYPSKALAHLVINFVEPVLSEKLNFTGIPRDFVKDVMESLDCIDCSGIGCCVEHGPLLVANLLSYYVTLRIWFFCRRKNKEEIRSGVARKTKMKLGKLT